MSHAHILEKRFPGRENSQCKGPDAGLDLACSRKSKRSCGLSVLHGVVKE